MLHAATMLVATGAQAQSNACDQLKGVLAARIEATGVRGYSLEAVPAGTPVPRGAKAIGNCDSGASKILYRRWGGAQPAADGTADAVTPASAPQAGVVPDEQSRQAPDVRVDRPSRPVAPSAPSPAPRPASRSNSAASAVAAPAPPAALTPPPPAPAPAREPATPLSGRASEVEAAPAIDRAVAAPAQAASAEPIAVGVPLAQQASEFIAENGRWLWALVLLPIVGGLWVWRTHRSAYDEAGLPRGPKLRI